MTEKKNTELALIEDFQLPALPDKDEIEEEMDGLVLHFDRVKIPSGGGLAFELPGDDDEPDLVKEIVGVILYHHPCNAYWRDKYSGANNPPDCASMDGKYGTGEPGGACRVCPLNEYGSDIQEDGTPGKGKACKNMRRIYIIREGEMFPLLLTLPPTSIGNFSDYIRRRVVQKRLRSYEIVTKVKLTKAVSGGGITYSQASFSFVGMLKEQDRQAMKEYAEMIKGMASGVSISEDDYEGGSNNGDVATDAEEKIFSGQTVNGNVPF